LRLSSVYVIAPESGRPVKIGHGGTAKSRLGQLQIGNWQELKIAHEQPVPAAMAQALEKAAHVEFAGRRLRGEWFDVPAEAARIFLSETAARWIDERQAGDDFGLTECLHLCDEPRAAYAAITRFRGEPSQRAGSISARLLKKAGVASHVLFTQVVTERRDISGIVRNDSRLAKQAEATMVKALNALVSVYGDLAAEKRLRDTKALDAAYARQRAA